MRCLKSELARKECSRRIPAVATENRSLVCRLLGARDGALQCLIQRCFGRNVLRLRHLSLLAVEFELEKFFLECLQQQRGSGRRGNGCRLRWRNGRRSSGWGRSSTLVLTYDPQPTNGERAQTDRQD